MYGLTMWVDGTSMAAPHVAAEASILLAKDSEKNGRFVKGLIKETAKDLGGGEAYGAGIVDVKQAVEQYDTYEENYQSGEEEVNLPENSESVDTFTDAEVEVGARWQSENHVSLVKNAVDKLNATGTYDYISADAMVAMRRGGVYSDKCKKTSGTHVFSIFWHGLSYSETLGQSINYVACYRFITEIASYGGDTTKVRTSISGLPSGHYNKMKSMITTTKIKGEGGVWWDWDHYEVDSNNKVNTVMGLDPNEEAGLENTMLWYRGSSTRKEKLRKCFLYGMAIHAATDAFAHSTYYKNPIQLIDHTTMTDSTGKVVKTADNPEVCRNRFEDAQAAAQRTVEYYLKNISGDSSGIGSIAVFTPAMKNRGAAEDYYLANIKKYAKSANGGSYPDKYDELFKYINLDVSYE